MAVDYDLGTARGRIEIDSSQLGRTSDALRSTGRGMAALGIAAAAGFAVVVKSAADFEHQMSAVRAVSGASRAEMALLEEQALTLGSTTVYSAGEIGGAMEALAKAGIPVEDMLNGATEATVNLAAAAGDELPGGVERAAEVIANAMKTFNAGADEMDHFADVLVGAAASSTLSVEDLAVSFRYAAPIAAALGLSIDDLSTTLAILGDRGIRGSTAGTSLRGVLLSLTPSSAKARDAMKELGLITEDGSNRFYDLQGNLKPIPEVMGILGDATKDLSEQEKVAAFNAIFQRRAMNAAMILAEQGTEGFNNYAAAIGAIDASDVAETKLDNLSGDMTKLKNSVNALLIRAGKPFQDMLRGWVQGITDLVNRISEMDPELLKMIVQIGAIAGVVLIAGGAFLMFASWIIRAYRTFIVVKEAITLLASAMKLLTLSFLTNPVVLIIAALVALGAILYLAYQRSETFRQAFDSAFDRIQPTIEAVVGWVQNFISLLDELWRAFQAGGIESQSFINVLDKMGLNGEMISGILVRIRDALIWLRDAAVAAFDYFANNVLPVMLQVGIAIIGGIGAAISWIVGTAIPAIVDFATAVGNVAMDIANWVNTYIVPVFIVAGAVIAAAVFAIIAVVRFLWPVFVFAAEMIGMALENIMTIVQFAVDFIVRAWQTFGDNVIQAVMLAFNFVKSFIEGSLTIIRGILTFFAGLFTLDWSMMWEGLKMIVSGFWTLVQSIISLGLGIIQLLIENALDMIRFAWDTAWALIGTVVQMVWNAITTFLGAAVQAIIGMFTNFGSLLATIWTATWDLISSLLGTALSWIVQAVIDGVGNVISWIATIPGDAMDALSGIGEALLSRGQELIQGLKNGAVEIFWDVLGWITGLPGNIVDALGDLGSLLVDAGAALIQGLMDGIDSMLGPLDEMVSGALGAVGDLLPGSPVKKGPLRVLNKGYAGKQIVRMLMAGMASQNSAMARTAAGIMSTAATPLNSGIPAGSISNRDSVQVNINLYGVSGDPNELRATLTDQSMLDEIINAARAGRR